MGRRTGWRISGGRRGSLWRWRSSSGNGPLVPRLHRRCGGWMPLKIELVQAPTDEVNALVGELEAELSGDYASHQRHGYSVARIFQPNILFFVASVDGRAVGCGGIAFEDGFAEVKRMYVRPESRGRGVGQSILQRLEE